MKNVFFLILLAFAQSSFGFVPKTSHANFASMVKNNNKSSMERNVATNDKLAEKFAQTPESKYPTMRGETVDSRKIIATGAGRLHLTAVRIAHILFASMDLAEASLNEVRMARITFEDLAKQISNCAETREKGGSVGWVTIDDQDGTKNEHLDEIFPPQAREQAIHITTKPGDIVMVESPRGYHLVQIVDVMADVRKMSRLKQRKVSKNGYSQSGARVASIGVKPVDGEETKDLTYKLETMGCQMNMADSERIEGQLQGMGIRPFVEDKDADPDVVVLNTCSIREHAESKVYSYLGPYAKRKREGEDVAIVVAGCVAQQESEALLRRVPEVDLVMGPQYANRLGDFFEDIANGNQVVATEATHIMEDSSKPRRQSKVCAWVNVIYGCNERCAFCIVPTTRGVEQSRPLESIVQEIEELVAQGYKEVTLLGQNIDAYGRDMVPKRRFSDLLKTAGSVPGLKRLRFVTSHPRYMSLSVVDEIQNVPSVCDSIHIPFQSGSNAILSSMGRGHTREKYLLIVDRIRSVRRICCNWCFLYPVKSIMTLKLICFFILLSLLGPSETSRSIHIRRCHCRLSRRDRGGLSRHLAFDGRGQIRHGEHRRLFSSPQHPRSHVGEPNIGRSQERQTPSDQCIGQRARQGTASAHDGQNSGSIGGREERSKTHTGHGADNTKLHCLL